MGYSHYWGINPALESLARNVSALDTVTMDKIARIVDHYQEGFNIAETTIKPNALSLIPKVNASGGCYASAFVWTVYNDGIDGGSCRGHDPVQFEDAICLILILLRQYYRGLFVFSSDGGVHAENRNDVSELREGWPRALAIAEHFGITIDSRTLCVYMCEEEDILHWMYNN